MIYLNAEPKMVYLNAYTAESEISQHLHEPEVVYLNIYTDRK